MKNIKVGDVVHVRLHVVSLTANKTGEYWLHLNPGEPGDVDHGIYLTEDNIIHIEPRPLKVGDKVVMKVGSPACNLEIIAIHNKFLWVRGKDCGFITVFEDKVELIND